MNLALSFSRHGVRTGILDTDIFGPSIPTLLGLSDAGEPKLTDKSQLLPLVSYGLKSMSMGYLLPSEDLYPGQEYLRTLIGPNDGSWRVLVEVEDRVRG